jgi:type II secretory pathway component PulM
MALQQRDRKALKAMAVALGLWLVLRFAVLPVWDRWAEARAELPLRENALIKYRQALAGMGAAAESEELLQRRLREAEEGLLQGASAALASAELQGWVKQTTASHEIEVRSSEFLPVRGQENGYAQVPLGLQFQCRLDQLVNFLAELQASDKTLTVPRFQVQARSGNEKLVSVSLTVAGVMRAEESQTSPAR